MCITGFFIIKLDKFSQKKTLYRVENALQVIRRMPSLSTNNHLFDHKTGTYHFVVSNHLSLNESTHCVRLILIVKHLLLIILLITLVEVWPGITEIIDWHCYNFFQQYQLYYVKQFILLVFYFSLGYGYVISFLQNTKITITTTIIYSISTGFVVYFCTKYTYDDPDNQPYWIQETIFTINLYHKTNIVLLYFLIHFVVPGWMALFTYIIIGAGVCFCSVFNIKNDDNNKNADFEHKFVVPKKRRYPTLNSNYSHELSAVLVELQESQPSLTNKTYVESSDVQDTDIHDQTEDVLHLKFRAILWIILWFMQMQVQLQIYHHHQQWAIGILFITFYYVLSHL